MIELSCWLMQPKHIPFFSILSGITAIPKTGIPGIYSFCFHAEFIYYHDFASGIRRASVSMQLKCGIIHLEATF